METSPHVGLGRFRNQTTPGYPGVVFCAIEKTSPRNYRKFSSRCSLFSTHAAHVLNPFLQKLMRPATAVASWSCGHVPFQPAVMQHTRRTISLSRPPHRGKPPESPAEVRVRARYHIFRQRKYHRNSGAGATAAILDNPRLRAKLQKSAAA